MKKYLITGGLGFIGSHLGDALLAQGHHVRILDDLSTGHLSNVQQDKCEIFIGSVEDKNAVDRAMEGMDGCFHLAAIASVQRSNEDWAGTHAANQTGSVNVFNAARFANPAGPIPVVYASSAAVYGNCDQLPIVESAGKDPLTAYGADKLGSELHAAVAGRAHGVPTVGLRFFNVYGPRQDPSSPYSGVISIFVDRIAKAQSPTVFGDGGQTRDFIFVFDVVNHLLAAMQKATPKPQAFNVCTGQATSIVTLGEQLIAAMGQSVTINHGPAREGDIRHSQGNPQNAVATLEVKAQTPLDEGLKQLVAWVAAQGG
ncbi:NAD-dependent epimerase/dehydratase family protein [Magnetofaba australis]|uniref:NAD-dependent epimerase/dehydratase family protein n=1 Tax=Magnetofaba australis TaxID=1472297 RepID=UPI000A19C168|nr:NAD-dependent epimerase/dehydratase family protein [Magnetofaba australis]